MSTDSPEKTAALSELKTLDGAFVEAETRRDADRAALHDAILRHLRARSARPGDIADHTPYDRVWVGKLASVNGVPSLRPKNQPAIVPAYDPDTVAAALAELDALSSALQTSELAVEKAREPLHDAIGRHRDLVGATELSRVIRYDRNHIGRIAKAAKEQDAGRA